MARFFSPRNAFVAIALSSIFVACGGGGGGGTSPTIPIAPQSGTVQFTVTEAITPPSVSTYGRSPQFPVPPATQSLSIALQSVNGTPAPSSVVNANISSTATGCTASSSTITCQISASPPAGTDVFTATTYSQSNEQGTNLGTGSLSVVVTAGQTTQAPATLNGTIASLVVSVLGTVPEGIPTSLPVLVVGKDTNGNTIIGTYSNPVTLTDTDSSTDTTLSATSVASSSATVTLAYNGKAMAQPAVLGATVSGVASSAVTPTSFLPDGSQPTVNGAVQAFSNTSSITTVTVGNPGPSPSPQVSNTTFSVSYATGTSYNNVTGLVQTTTEYPAPAPSASPTIDTNYNLWTPTGSSDAWGYVGGTETSSGTTGSYSWTCTAPYAPYWVVPLPASWNYYVGTGPCAFQQTSPGNFTYTETYNADGSYTGTTDYTQPPSTATIAVSSNGTAVTTDNSSTGSSIVTIATPAPGASSIPVEVQDFSGSIPAPGASATPAPVATSIPNWYVAAGVPNGVVPSPLQSEIATNKGSTTLPAACKIPTSIVGSGTAVDEVDEGYTGFDPSFSYVTWTMQNYVVNGLGVVCASSVNTDYFAWGLLALEYSQPYGSFGGDQIVTTTRTWYLTASSLQAAMSATGSFADALPAAARSMMPPAMSSANAALLQRQAFQKRIEALMRAREAQRSE